MDWLTDWWSDVKQVEQVRRGVQAEQEVAVRVARGGDGAGKQAEEEPAPREAPLGQVRKLLHLVFTQLWNKSSRQQNK